MSIIIPQPTPGNTEEETLYQARLNTIRILASPDITLRVTAEELPDAILEDAAYLQAAERRVMRETAKTEADITALANDAEERIQLIYAVQLQIAIRIIPQVAQLVREQLMMENRQYQTIDWNERITKLQADYSVEVLSINPDAEIQTDDTLTAPVGMVTTSRKITQ